MRFLIIGAAGLVGRALAATLAAHGATSLRLADRVPVRPPGPPGTHECRTGDFCHEDFARDLLRDVDCVFHLAALLATDCEANLDAGLAVNVEGLMRLLRLCSERPAPPRFLFASSIAAFGGPLPPLVDDTVPRTPQSSYGTHKAIAELLIDDYSRRGLIDGRTLRLPIVLVRNGLPGAAVSDRVAALVREPLLGRNVACGLRPDTLMPVASARRVATAFRRLAAVDAGALGHARAMNLPSLSVTAAELAEAVARAPVRGKGEVTWAPDPALQAIVDTWPERFGSNRAEWFALAPNETADDIVADFVDENGLG